MTHLVNPPNEPVPNARLFIYDRFTVDDEMHLRSHGGVRRRWIAGAWQEMSDDDLNAEVYRYFDAAEFKILTETGSTIVPFLPTKHRVKEIESAVAAVSHLPDSESMPFWIDKDGGVTTGISASELVPMTNGILHVPERRLLAPTPQFFCPYALPYAYDPDAPKPERWIQLLDEVWSDDQESKDLLQEFMGYLLVSDTSQQKMLLIVGPPRSGKGTISRLMRDLIGEHNFAGPTLASLRQNFGLQPLIGKPVAVISDARFENKGDSSAVVERLLSITGEDPLTIDRKYKPQWNGPLPTRLIILTNELPRLIDASGALASRFLILQMTNSFLGQEDPGLSSKLRQERSGILLWALDGLERLRGRGHFLVPERSNEVVREMADLSSPTKAFVRDCCIVDPLTSVSVSDMFDEWRRWCDDMGIEYGNKQMFGRDLRAVVPDIQTSQQRSGAARLRRYNGIGLARDGTRS